MYFLDKYPVTSPVWTVDKFMVTIFFLPVAEFKYTVFSWNAALPCLQESKIFLGALSVSTGNGGTGIY